MEKIAVRAIITNDEGKILIGKRANKSWKNRWSLIGGKPDFGETLVEAVVREVKEEIGVRFQNPVFWKEEINDITVPGEFWRTGYFFGNIEGNIKLKSDEISEIKYISRQDLDNFDIAFGHDKILEEFFSRKG